MHIDLNTSGRVSQWMRNKRISFATAAAEIGVAVGALHAWATGRAFPSRLAIPPLAKALGMSAEDLTALVARERAARRLGAGHGQVPCQQDDTAPAAQVQQ